MSSWKISKELDNPELGTKKAIVDVRLNKQTGKAEYLIADVKEIEHLLSVVSEFRKQQK